MLYKKIISFFLLVFLVGRVSIAEEKRPEFTTVKAGQQAPFSGYLFTPEAMAQMLAQIDEDKRKQDAEHTAEVATLKLDIQSETERRIAESAVHTRLVEDLNKAKQEQIAIRDRRISELESEKIFNNLLVAGSFVAGIALTAGIVYITTGMAR